MEEKIKQLLSTVIHPETGKSIVESGFVDNISATESKITVTLRFSKSRDPFALKIKNQVQSEIEAAYPSAAVTIIIKESAQSAKPKERRTNTGAIANIIAISSGKGGVGKSTVTANIAITLRNMGFRVGILDADIYGPSQPKMFGVEDFVPEAQQINGEDVILPADVDDIRLMSIGFFIKPNDALLWRGAMATNALKQLIHQTKWGTLDYLLIDLPPGTGDVHLSIISELKITSAVIVSTPQQVAVADVRRGVEMFRNPQVNIPIAGIIENMAWFTPAELPDNRYYIFGRGGARDFAEQNGVPFLGEIPIIQSIMEGAEGGKPATMTDAGVEKYYRETVDRIINNSAK